MGTLPHPRKSIITGEWGNRHRNHRHQRHWCRAGADFLFSLSAKKYYFCGLFFSIYIFMNINKLIFSIAASCIFSLGCAQCPDSVQVYVDPEVICPGEIAHLSTDSLLLHCVNIGDIICVNSDTQDTAIVSPNDWTHLSQNNNLTALSVVFYVDSTCKHGWAVKAESNYGQQQWKNNNTQDNNTNHFDFGIEAFRDLDGYNNTQTLKNSVTGRINYPAAVSTSLPFYLPALGQLNYLFSQSAIINASLQSINTNYALPNGNVWSSTNSTYNNQAHCLNWKTGELLKAYDSGDPNVVTKNEPNYVLPVMNF